MLENEPLFPLAVAVNEATGQKRSLATCHRWRLNGIGGIHLETVKLGGRRLSSIAAVRRFIALTTAIGNHSQPSPTRTNRQKEATIRQAERTLERAGV